MTDLALFLVLALGALAIVTIAACVALITVAVSFALEEHRERVRVQRRARRAADAYGLSLVEPDEVSRRRWARDRKGHAA